MAITYHAGRRIQGISITPRQAGSGLTFCDNFSTDKGWATSCSTYMDYDSGNSRLKTVWNGCATNKTVVYDLGEGMVSDTKWVLRMKINMGSTNGADNEGFIGLSDSDETAGKCTAQDFAGVSFLAGYSTTAWNGLYEAEADGVTLPPTAGNLLVYNFSDSTDYWLEIKRTSATALTYTLYSDAFSTSLGTQSVTIASGVSGLRYIKLANYPAASTNQPGAYVDDIQFYNDVTSTGTTPVAEVPASGDTKPTNVQAGSRFEETDTRKVYDFIDPDVTNQDIEWQCSSKENATICGNTLTATAGGWTVIARSVQTISPSRGGGTVIGKHSKNYGMFGFSKDPYWTSGNTFANGDYMIYHDEVYELGSGKSGSSFTGADNNTLYKVTMDSDGLVKYFADTGSGYTEVYESTVTASGEYYVLGIPDGSGKTVSDITITGTILNEWKEVGT